MKRLAKKIRKGLIDLTGKCVAISGATGGIGRELCSALAGMGASLILLDRNANKSEELGKELRARFSGVAVRHVTLDLEDTERLREVAELLLCEPIDYLILNAGAYSIPRRRLPSGYDNVFQINFVAPYYLARRLAPNIAKRGGRIVAVGSIAHDYSKIDPDDIDFSTRTRASRVYGNAKRHLMFSLAAIEGAGEGGVVAITHPGITQTNITAHYPKLVYAVIKYPMRVIFMRPKKACLSILCGMFEPTGECEWIGPRFFGVWGLPKKTKLKTCDSNERNVIINRANAIFFALYGKGRL